MNYGMATFKKQQKADDPKMCLIACCLDGGWKSDSQMDLRNSGCSGREDWKDSVDREEW